MKNPKKVIFKNLNLDKYNKRLLAVLGTVLSLGLVIILIIAIIGLSFDLSRRVNRNNRVHNNDGVVINQGQVVDTATHTFHQELSILEPYQLDTISPVFIVPIGQKDQTEERVKMDMASLSFNASYSSSSYKYSNFNGLYNNFVLIDYTRNIKKELFSKKVALTEWAFLKIDSTKLVVIKGTDEDTNEDGRLNDDDLQSLFVFNVQTLESKVLKFENQTVRSFEPLKLTSKIYVRTGKDIDKDKTFDSYSEPTDIYFYDVKTGEHETLIPEDIKKNLQDILN